MENINDVKSNPKLSLSQDEDSSKDNFRTAVVHESNLIPSTEETKICQKAPKKFAALDLELAVTCDDIQASPDFDGDIIAVIENSQDVFDNENPSGPRFISYSRVFDVCRFSELMPEVFIHNCQINIQVIDMEPLPSSLNLFNQCLFTIVLRHGITHWTIKRKSRQISSLHNQLRLFKTKLKLPAATSVEREKRQSMRIQIKRVSASTTNSPNKETCNDKTKRFVKYPRRALQRVDGNSIADVEAYLNGLLGHSLLRSHCSVLEFFEISPLSFVCNLGPKLKEGFVKKRSGGRNALSCCGGQFKTRWLVLKETCIFCLSPKGHIRTVMLIDAGFQVSHGFRHTSIPKGLLITNLSRSLIVKCSGEESEREWSSAIEYIRNNYGAEFASACRHLSFAPVRRKSYARWYVDGSYYMNDVADLLDSAQEEIFITDWWLSPDIYLKRPDLTGRQWKLSEVLNRQAARGVKIFVLLYKEVELALGLNSLYTKHNLSVLNSSIKVLRHPDHYKGSLYWAHHEKMIIIDQMHAFVGGIDLCYGRWDDYRHKLVDVGHGGLINQKLIINPFQQLFQSAHNIFLPSVSNGHSELQQPVANNKGMSSDTTDHISPPIDINHTLIGKPTNYSNDNVKVKIMIFPPQTKVTKIDSITTDHESLTDVTKTESITIDHGLLTDMTKTESITTDHKSLTDVMKTESITTDPEVLISHFPVVVNSELVKCNETSEKVNMPIDNYTRVVENVLNVEDKVSSAGAIYKESQRPSYKFKEKSYEEENKIMPSESSQKHPSLMTRNLKAVKTLGLDLVDEMKERSKEVRQWTERKVPHLRRTGSLNSEINMNSSSDGELSERNDERPKRLHRKIRRRMKFKSKNLSDEKNQPTGSLADLHRDLTHEEANSVHLWIGKDYVNWITKDLYDPQIPFFDNVNRHQTPRMPWHDIALYVEGAPARDAARHFIQRWNAVKSEKVKNNHYYPYLIPRTYKPSSFMPSGLKLKHKVKCQVLRSIGGWSGGLTETENSIYNAYVDAIKSSKHFIYIENQFFITSSSNNKSEISNSIGYHLVQRIIKAHRNKETFRVYIVLPLLPAFEGQIGTPSGVAMQYIVHYTYQSIIRGPNSLIGMLTAAQVNWQHFLSFCSLRTHDVLEGQLITELIYVHSKLLIVDDRLVIAGSANINDRSLLGDRDSEVDLVIEDEEFTVGVMNGKEFRRGEFAGSLRIYLFNEHLGVSKDSNIDVSDPISEQFFARTWQTIASRNSKIYDEVFNCVPSDSATTFAELRRLRNKIPLAKLSLDKSQKLLQRIIGRLVLYPLMFLKDEVVKPGLGNKEFLLPVEMWT